MRQMLGNPTKRHPSTPHILFDSLDNIQYYKRAFLSLELRVWQTGLERPLLPSPQSTNGSPKFRGHMSRLLTFFFFSTRHRETELDSLYRLRSICCTAKQHTYGHMCTHSRHAQLHLWLKTFQIFFLFWREIKKKFLFKNRSAPSYRMFTHTHTHKHTEGFIFGYKYTDTNRCEVSP